MTLGLISDVHGNYEALRAVLAALDGMGVTEILSRGDVVGYYSQVNECCDELRARGVRAGLFRPITLWPFPIERLRPVAAAARRIVVVEASAGQLEDELRLALAKDGAGAPVIDHVRRMGGVLPQQDEILDHVLSLEGGAA